MQAIAARSHAVTLLYPLQGEPEDWGPERGRRGSIPARGREEGNANAIGLQGRGVRPLRAAACPPLPSEARVIGVYVFSLGRGSGRPFESLPVCESHLESQLPRGFWWGCQEGRKEEPSCR